MKYPVTFSADMQYLSSYYGWTEDDKQEVRASFRDCEPMVRYFTVLAAAHRAGYKQDAGNGFVRLRDWCLQNGLDDPYGEFFDPDSLDALVVEPRKANA